MLAVTTSSTEAAFNLALEEVLFTTLPPNGGGLFLIWRNRPSIIVGRHQNTAEEINAQWCRENDVDVVRRSTGGGTVYHDLGNVNFSFMTTAPDDRIRGFEPFMLPMVEALHDLGADAVFTSRNDITVGGRKIAGTAQRRDGRKILHHGCLLVDTDTSRLESALAADPEKFASKGVASHRAHVANLTDFLPQFRNGGECMDAVIHAMTVRCTSGSTRISEQAIAAAERLAAEKYRTWEWTWGRSPRHTERKKRRFPWGRIECLLDVKNGIIDSCRLYGDFFTLRPLAELEAAFSGIRADPQTMARTATACSAESWFAGAERTDIISFLLEN